MKTAFDPDRTNVTTSITASGLARSLRIKTERLLRRSEHVSSALCSAGDERPRNPDDSSLGEAIRLAQQGDAAAFEFIYRLHCRRVYSLCLRIVKDPSEAEDLAQEAFMQLFRKIHTFRGESAFSSWLHRLTVNIVLMRLRKKKLNIAKDT